MANETPFQQHGDMVNFLLQPEIQAVLLTALFGVIAWGFIEWRRSRQRAKKLNNPKIENPASSVPLQVIVNVGNAPKASSLLHQLPSPPASFMGRDEELAELKKEITAAHKVGATIPGKHVGLQGMGGVGKTALATVLAHNLKDHYPNAQLCVNLRGADPDHRPPLKPAEAMQTIIHAFLPEEKLPEELDKLAPIYNSVLNRAGRVLLFLDNAADAHQVKPLLPPANCLLLVTSRTHFSLPGLTARSIDCLHPEKSQELLLKLAPRIKGHEKEATELCGNLPLALEVFAGVVENNKLFSSSVLLEDLRKRPAKETEADAAFRVSYDLLADDLRPRWTVLAIFPASFDLAAGAAVWNEKEDSARNALQALVNASLVEWNQANGRFRLHDLVRQFCDGKLTEVERTTAMLRHAGYYRNIALVADQLYLKGGESVLRGLELFDRERMHIEAALEWLKSRQDIESAKSFVSLVGAVTLAIELRFNPNQRIHWLEAQRNAARIIKNRQAEGSALCNLGLAWADLGNTRKAIEFYEQALMIDRAVGDLRQQSKVINNLGIAYGELGDMRKAIGFYQQRLVIARQTGDRRGECAVLGNLGTAYGNLGQVPMAIELHEAQLTIAREIGDRRLEGSALGGLGIAYGKLDAQMAVNYCEQALLIDREIGDQRGESRDLGNLGTAYGDLGELRKAIECFDGALIIKRRMGDQRGEGNSLINSALALHRLGERGQAIARAEAALKIFETIEDPNATKVRAKLVQWRAAKS